ncbi:ABC transporter ATP-binding protein [Pleomorphochaeta sp. DL1XJH-081]|jgi:ABC-2 type transport system ATP-binding protein|uniref:ABC transporter ATP-binding protein n=1 Tax=Pleomorphochaeta sp. DL1XJH-081 TaxID=3409690 RepID=UPI003BB5B9AB
MGEKQMAIIEINNLKKRYGTVLALDGVSLSVDEGTVFGFLGPNGAGKTTLIRILTGLICASSGSFLIDGRKTSEAKERYGYLAQQPSYYGWMTGRELLDLSGNIYGMDSKEKKRRIPEMLHLCGIEDAADRRIGGYSGGMRQRLGIAQAILHDPKVVFLDEPVSALDPVGRKEILSLITILRERTTIFMSSHILDDIQKTCDEVAIINKGSIRIQEKTKTLLRLHAQPIVHMEFDSKEAAQLCHLRMKETGIAASKSDYTVSIPSGTYDSESNRILTLIGKEGLKLEKLEHQEATLEDVFMHHIQEVTDDIS